MLALACAYSVLLLLPCLFASILVSSTKGPFEDNSPQRISIGCWRGLASLAGLLSIPPADPEYWRWATCSLAGLNSDIILHILQYATPFNIAYMDRDYLCRVLCALHDIGQRFQCHSFDGLVTPAQVFYVSFKMSRDDFCGSWTHSRNRVMTHFLLGNMHCTLLKTEPKSFEYLHAALYTKYFNSDNNEESQQLAMTTFIEQAKNMILSPGELMLAETACSFLDRNCHDRERANQFYLFLIKQPSLDPVMIRNLKQCNPSMQPFLKKFPEIGFDLLADDETFLRNRLSGKWCIDRDDRHTHDILGKLAETYSSDFQTCPILKYVLRYASLNFIRDNAGRIALYIYYMRPWQLDFCISIIWIRDDVIELCALLKESMGQYGQITQPLSVILSPSKFHPQITADAYAKSPFYRQMILDEEYASCPENAKFETELVKAFDGPMTSFDKYIFRALLKMAKLVYEQGHETKDEFRPIVGLFLETFFKTKKSLDEILNLVPEYIVTSKFGKSLFESGWSKDFIFKLFNRRSLFDVLSLTLSTGSIESLWRPGPMERSISPSMWPAYYNTVLVCFLAVSQRQQRYTIR